MTRQSLNSDQRRLLGIIESLGFGHIQGLTIRSGDPCFARPPHVVEEIRLASEPERRPDRSDTDTLKKRSERLFNQLNLLHDGVVDIDVQHGLPFRLVLERRYEELP